MTYHVFSYLGGQTTRIWETSDLDEACRIARSVRGCVSVAGGGEGRGGGRATPDLLHGRSKGSVEKAQQIATHESPRTTKLYDRTSDEVTQNEIERIRLMPAGEVVV